MFYSWQQIPPGITVHALALHPARHMLRERRELRQRVVAVPADPRMPGDCLAALREWARFAPGDGIEIGEYERVFERGALVTADAAPVSDQLARLWASRQARIAARADQPGTARSLGRRYRLVTDDVSAVVLENREQYEQFGIDSDATIGREPERPIGSGTVPEPATWLLLASGLAVACWLRRRRAE